MTGSSWASMTCRVAVDVTLERQGRVLHDTDLVPRLLQQVVDTLPAGPVHETAVHENHIALGLGVHDGLLSRDLDKGPNLAASTRPDCCRKKAQVNGGRLLVQTPVQPKASMSVSSADSCHNRAARCGSVAHALTPLPWTVSGAAGSAMSQSSQ